MSTQYDVVWCTDGLRGRALDLVKSLPEDVLSDRHLLRHRTRGLRRWVDNAPIPDAQGFDSGLRGHCLMLDFWGSTACSPGAMKTDPDSGKSRLEISRDLDLVVIESGLVVGNFKPGVLDRPEFKKAETEERSVAQDALSRLDQASDPLPAADLEQLSARYFRAIATLAGVRNAQQLSDDQARDAAMLFALAHPHDVPSLEAWLALAGGIPSESNSPGSPDSPHSPSTLDPIEEAREMQSLVVQRREEIIRAT